MLALYRKEVKQFIVWWWLESDYDLDDVQQLDECLVGYSFYNSLTKARTSTLLAAVSLALPTVRKSLPWFRLVTEETIRQVATKHSLGMPRTAALVLSVMISQTLSPRAGALLLIQQGRGLRPGEALSLRPQSITLPGDTLYNKGMLTLGLRGGTKSGRPEFVLLEPAQHSLEIALAEWLRNCTNIYDTLSLNLSVSGYAKLLNRGCAMCQLPVYTPHGARAGYVSDAAIRGETLPEIMKVTRHQAVKSLQSYMDSVNHLQQLHAGPVRRWTEVARLIQQYPDRFFPQLSATPKLNPLKLV